MPDDSRYVRARRLLIVIGQSARTGIILANMNDQYPLQTAEQTIRRAMASSDNPGHIEVSFTLAERVAIISALRYNPYADPDEVADIIAKLRAEPDDDPDRDIFTASLAAEEAGHLNLVVCNAGEHREACICCRDLITLVIPEPVIPEPQTQLPEWMITRVDEMLGVHGYRRVTEWKMEGVDGLLATADCRIADEPA